jgi:D-aspartate ligase
MGARNLPPAIVVGGLNLVRPLGMAGIASLVATADARHPALASRYCSGRLELPGLEHKEAVVSRLVEEGDRIATRWGRKAPLIYGNDDWLDFIQEHREALVPYFGLVLNDPDVAAGTVSKQAFARLAASRGVPVPRTLSWEELSRSEGRVLVKPRVKMGWEHSGALLRLFGNGEGEASKARVFDSGREVLGCPEALQLRDYLICQEYVDGDDRCLWSFHGFADERGRLLASFVGRKVRTFPALTGSSAYLELARDAAIDALGREIVAQVPLKGPFKIDIKKDARTGRCYVLEVNARYNLWHYLGAANGVNLPAIAYDYMARGILPVAEPHHGTSVRWLCLPLDVRAYRELSASGECTLMGWLASLAGSRKVYDLFSWTDPMPFVQSLRFRAVSKLQHVLARLGMRLQRWRSTAS